MSNVTEYQPVWSPAVDTDQRAGDVPHPDVHLAWRVTESLPFTPVDPIAIGTSVPPAAPSWRRDSPPAWLRGKGSHATSCYCCRRPTAIGR